VLSNLIMLTPSLTPDQFVKRDVYTLLVTIEYIRATSYYDFVSLSLMQCFRKFLVT
jgi:hypothetical protein